MEIIKESLMKESMLCITLKKYLANGFTFLL